MKYSDTFGDYNPRTTLVYSLPFYSDSVAEDWGKESYLTLSTFYASLCAYVFKVRSDTSQ